MLLLFYLYHLKWIKSENLLTRTIEEVILKRDSKRLKKETLNKQIKDEMLQKKKKRKENNQDFFTAQMIVKDYREKQKSHSYFKRKVHIINKDKSTNPK